MNTRSLFIALLMISSCLPLAAQEEEGVIDYEREILYGIDFNTNAGLLGGIFYRNAKYMGNNKFRTLGLELVNVKHPKELRYQSALSGNVFVAGKQNYLFSLRGQYGRNFILFNKSREDGVQVELITAIGPTIGIVKPYMIYYQYSSTDMRAEQYDPTIHTDFNKIDGSAGFFKNFFGSKISMGLHTKLGASFEFGHYTGGVTGLEVGGLLEVFPKEIIIIPSSQNKNVFTSIYINIYYGARK